MLLVSDFLVTRQMKIGKCCLAEIIFSLVTLHNVKDKYSAPRKTEVIGFWKGLILSMLPRYDVVLHHVIEWYAGKTKHNFSKI